MKLAPRDAPAYFARPDPEATGLLIFGSDAMRVALRRQEVIAALIGPQGEEEMRLTRIPASELRKDPAMLSDAIKAQSFFPGPRVAFLEDATDGLAKTVEAAISDWRKGDAQVIVTAGMLTARSSLRKLFEGHPSAYAVGIYDDPPSRAEIEQELKRSGLEGLDRDAMEQITALSRQLEPGDFRQTLQKLGLYKLDDDTPLSPEDVAACAPTSTEADLDDILDIVAEGRAPEIGPVMARLKAQGVQPVSLCIGATRHFRTLYSASADPQGPGRAVARLPWPRRAPVERQSRAWGAAKLEDALSILTDTDLTLRSAGQHAPAMELVERAMIRLAMLARR